MSREEKKTSSMRIDRLEALVDGAMAIVLTLLVLLVKMPEPHESTGSVLGDLREQWHVLVAYAISFILVAIYWLNHHAIFHYIRRATLGLVWINLLFLLCVCFVPFPTTLVVNYPEDRFCVVIYGGAHLFVSGTLVLMWQYLLRRPELMHADPNIVRRTTIKLTFMPLAYILVIGLSFIDLWVGFAVALSVPIVHLLMDHTNLYQVRNEEAVE